MHNSGLILIPTPTPDAATLIVVLFELSVATYISLQVAQWIGSRRKQ